MDINYDQFNGDALIFKYNIDEYGNPISIKVDKEEKQVSMHGTIQLEFVPDEYNRVVILNEDKSQMVEVFNRDEVKPNTYYIDYNNGVAYLDKTQFGKVKVYNYYKKGLQLIGCSRIYDEHDVTGKNVMMTLQEIIDAGKECIRILLDIGDAYQIITRLEKNIEIGNELHNTLNNDIEVGTPLQENLHSDIIEAKKWKDQLHNDVQEGKTLQPLLEQTINNGNQTKAELEQTIANAQDDIAIIEATGNEIINITSSEWTYNDTSKMYEKQITHTCKSENIHVTCKTSDTKEALFLPWKIVDKSNILLKSDEAINVSVVISASYYKALEDNSTTQEVIDARKGKSSLYEKVNSIDKQLEVITNSNVVLINKLDSYNKNDISKILNSLTYEEGKTYILDDGEVTSRSLINVNLPARCKLHLLGKINCETHFIKLRFPNNSNGGGEFKTEEIEYIGTTSQKDSMIAVEFKKGANIDLDLGVIKNFGFGLYMSGDEEQDWIQYCNIRFHEIEASQIGIAIYSNSDFNWINENNFYGGGLSGVHCVLMQKKGGNGSLINSNRFHDLGVYTNKTEVIYISDEGCQGNSFFNLRLWEQNWDTTKYIISDDGRMNYFSTKYKIPFELLLLGKESIFEGAVYGKIINDHTNTYELITDRIYKNDKGFLELRRFNEYNEGLTVEGVRKIYKYVDTIFCGMSEGENLTLDIQPYLCRKGITFFVRKNGAINSTLYIKLPEGKKVTIQGQTGLYKCNMIDNNWCEVYKIGDGDGIQPS